MPKLTEHNSTNQDPHSNQDYLSKYRNLKEIQSVKPKMSKKTISMNVTKEGIHFLNLKHSPVFQRQARL